MSDRERPRFRFAPVQRHFTQINRRLNRGSSLRCQRKSNQKKTVFRRSRVALLLQEEARVLDKQWREEQIRISSGNQFRPVDTLMNSEDRSENYGGCATRELASNSYSSSAGLKNQLLSFERLRSG